jgi:hypothetical protein
MQIYWECRYNSIILDLGTRWRGVVSFMPLPFYPLENIPENIQDRSLDETLSKSGEAKNFNPAENRTPTAQPIARLITYT